MVFDHVSVAPLLLIFSFSCFSQGDYYCLHAAKINES